MWKRQPMTGSGGVRVERRLSPRPPTARRETRCTLSQDLSGPMDTTYHSLVAQLVKKPSAIQETLVQFQGQEDLLEKG